MSECKNCANADNEYCFACENGNQFKPITNADRIRSMSDEELAKHLVCEHTICTHEKMDCNACMLDWLREEVSE